MEIETKKQKILIVDDEPANIRILGDVLKQSYRIMFATDGQEALEQAKIDKPPELILLDVVMPGINGYEVCRRLKADPFTKEIPVIFITGKVEEADEIMGFEVGGLDYISKPFNPMIVKLRVRNQLELKAAREALKGERDKLQKAIDEIKTLRGIILSTCCYCKRIKNKEGNWQEPAEIMQDIGAEISHGVCPDCLSEKNPRLYNKMASEGKL